MSTQPYVGTLAELFARSEAAFPEQPVTMYTDGTCSYTYAQMCSKCRDLDKALNSYGIGKGDRVAILSENMPHWMIAFFTSTVFGRITVPLLPDCSSNEVTNIITHSETKVVFVSKKQRAKITDEVAAGLKLIIPIETLEIDAAPECEPFPTEGTEAITPDDLTAIIYTSGTSGNAKGVMLSHRNLCGNMMCATHIELAYPGDVWLSVLPMGHTLEMSLGFLYAIYSGAKICYLKKAPTPAVLIPAFEAVKPTIMMVVPLILEKVYRKSVLKTINSSWALRAMRKVAPGLLYRIVGKKLHQTFGGRLRFFGIGGAKLDSEVEAFLQAAKFPYAIGYGMTECAPLICVATVGKTRVGSTGCAVHGMEVKLADVNPATGEGEIVARGPHLMLGYYKDEQRTADVIDKEGWLHTSDLAVMDSKGYFDIKGRKGNMILGPSGENIYPEEIEMVINGIEPVEESLLKQENGLLVALVKLASGSDMSKEEASRIRTLTNSRINKASQITELRFVEKEFEKTATKKIRRFLY